MGLPRLRRDDLRRQQDIDWTEPSVLAAVTKPFHPGELVPSLMHEWRAMCDETGHWETVIDLKSVVAGHRENEQDR